jgi:poly(3-hydroxybutyrate) depolymerase
VVSGTRQMLCSLRGFCRAWLALWCAGCVPSAAVSRSKDPVTANDASAPERAYRVAPLPLSLAGVRLEPGMSSVRVDAAGTKREFWLVVPEGELVERTLVVFLHGAQGGSGVNQLVRCLARPGFDALAPIIVAPVSATGQWWRSAEAGYVLGLVDAASQQWPVRADRVVISGYSNGGIGAWAFARLYPERFSAAIPMASDASVMGETPLAIYAIHGEKDELFAAEEVRAHAERLRRSGIDVTLEVRRRGSHMEPCRYVPELERGARWLTEHAWLRPSAKSN